MQRFLKHHLSPFKLQIGVCLILFTLLGLFALANPQTFLSLRIYTAFMSTIPFTAILALGLTFLIIAGELDLAFPSVMAFSGFVFALVYTRLGSPAGALLLSLVAGAMAGLINGLIVVTVGVPSIIATIGMQFFWRGLTTLLASGLAINLVSIRGTWLHPLMAGRIGGVLPVQALWCLGLAVFFWLMLNRHVFGDNLRFVGDDIKTAHMMGIDTNFTRVMLFTLMGLVSALVAVMVCLEMANWWPTQGEGYLLIVFASIFIGGTSVFGGEGTIFGTVVGACIIGIIEAGIISAGLSGFWTRLVYGLIIVLSVSIYARVLKIRRISF
ncbi:Related to sugar ABC transporter, permease protein [Desulfosarcina cetonica]|uniref:ABC transporter permease n=1 Tax=Desulfosarcina cetonica TaxID=90730 RepID=UPI0006CF4D0A|nr:ABC transporter permease [Desulfosarcina cetonica]VTR67485.1 Related to sugar ABC transporter, permease protein [Desulfosarcina cetonica]